MTDPTKYNACRDVKGKICRAEFVEGPDDYDHVRYRILDDHSTKGGDWDGNIVWRFEPNGDAGGGLGLQLLHLPEQDDRTALAAIAEPNPDWSITLPVDEADLQEARECAALACDNKGWLDLAKHLRAGKGDDSSMIGAALIAIKRNREASQ